MSGTLVPAMRDLATGQIEVPLVPLLPTDAASADYCVGVVVTDHAMLGGLGDDDHALYALSGGGRNTSESATHIVDTANPHSATIDQVTSTTTKGDLLVENGSTVARLPVGADTYILCSNSADPLGLAWEMPAAGGSTDHGALTGLGDDDHTQYALATGRNTSESIAHIADGSVHFTEGSIDHTGIMNIGTNSHAAIDTHIADGSIHFASTAVTLSSAGGTESLVSTGTGPNLETKGLVAGAGITLTPSGTDVTLSTTTTYHNMYSYNSGTDLLDNTDKFLYRNGAGNVEDRAAYIVTKAGTLQNLYAGVLTNPLGFQGIAFRVFKNSNATGIEAEIQNGDGGTKSDTVNTSAVVPGDCITARADAIGGYNTRGWCSFEIEY